MEDEKESTDAGTNYVFEEMGIKEDCAIFVTLLRSNLQLFLFSESVDTERDLGSVQEV